MQSGDAADQLVRMATNVSLKTFETASNIALKGTTTLATFLLAAIKSQNKKKGKVNIDLFKDKETKVFVIKREDMKVFAEEAKRYGVLYAAVASKDKNVKTVDVLISHKDAAKVSRISEKFAMSMDEVEKLRADILKSREKAKEQPQQESSQPAPQNTEVKSQNPIERTKKTRSSPSEISSEIQRDAKPSIKKEIQKIKEQRQKQVQKTQQTVHRQPRKKRRVKTKGGR